MKIITITIENNSCITQGRIIVEEPAWEYTIRESEWRIEQTMSIMETIITLLPIMKYFW